MGKTNVKKGTIAILTGGGDVPGLNPAIRAITVRALREGYRVLGIRRGWAGLVELEREKDKPQDDLVTELSEEIVNRAGRTGGTFLHTSRTNPSKVNQAQLPPHLKEKYQGDIVDVTQDVLANLQWLGVDTLIPIGGDDTLSYGVRLHKEGVRVIAIPKTMDNDVPGTDYCIGFSTCVTRTIEMTHALRTSAGSHERFLVIEVFGRYAGFTALLPTMAGASNRCVIPEHVFDIERLCELLTADRHTNPSKYSVVLVSEGATFKGMDQMVFEDQEVDAFGHKKLGGIGDRVSRALRDLSPKFNDGRRINVISASATWCGVATRTRSTPSCRWRSETSPWTSCSTGSRVASLTCATAATTTSPSMSWQATRRWSTCASSTTPTVYARFTSASRPSRSSS
jgi:6-phosphofructokinase